MTKKWCFTRPGPCEMHFLKVVDQKLILQTSHAKTPFLSICVERCGGFDMLNGHFSNQTLVFFQNYLTLCRILTFSLFVKIQILGGSFFKICDTSHAKPSL